MSNDNPPSNDAELRRTIRAEIAERDHQKQRDNQQREADKVQTDLAEHRRQIYQEELRKYYQNKPGYREVTRDDGEIDWVLESDLQKSEKLFDEVLEDPEVARKRLRFVLYLTAAGIILVVAILYYILHDRRGNVQVNCNIPGTQIILDTSPLDSYTDALLKEIPAGEHVITVEKDGYKIQGEPIRRINLKSGKTEVLSFILVPEVDPIDQSAPAPGEVTP